MDRALAVIATIVGFVIGAYYTVSHYTSLNPAHASMADLGALIMAAGFGYLILKSIRREN